MRNPISNTERKSNTYTDRNANPDAYRKPQCNT
jgi:hypothetical protein